MENSYSNILNQIKVRVAKMSCIFFIFIFISMIGCFYDDNDDFHSYSSSSSSWKKMESKMNQVDNQINESNQ